jgi:hypothetical protein
MAAPVRTKRTVHHVRSMWDGEATLTGPKSESGEKTLQDGWFNVLCSEINLRSRRGYHSCCVSITRDDRENAEKAVWVSCDRLSVEFHVSSLCGITWGGGYPGSPDRRGKGHLPVAPVLLNQNSDGICSEIRSLKSCPENTGREVRKKGGDITCPVFFHSFVRTVTWNGFLKPMSHQHKLLTEKESWQ